MDGYFRLYTTRDSRYRRLALWGINLSETDARSVRLHLGSLPPQVSVRTITRKTLAAYAGATSLVTRSSTAELVGWTETDLTGQLDPSDFAMTFGEATLTLLLFDLDVTPDAPLVVGPLSFDRTAFIGDTPPDETIMISSGGPDAVHYTIASDAAWLAPAPSSGTADRTAVPISVSYQLGGVAPGQHVGKLTISSDDSYNSPQTVTIRLNVETLAIDFDRDGDVDQEDFAHLQGCLSGSSIPQEKPTCASARLDGDADVDQEDMARFLRCVSGAGNPPIPNCQ